MPHWLKIMIRLYHSGDEAQINSLFKTVFQKARSIEEWHWKYEVLGTQKPIIVVYEENGEILGHAACIIFEDSIAERVDIMVHPEHQGKGIYKLIVKKLIQELEERDIKNVYGFPAEVAKKVFMKYGDAKDLGNIALLVAPILVKRNYNWRPIGECNLEELASYNVDLDSIHIKRSAEFLKRRYVSHPTNQYYVYEIQGQGYAVVRFEGNKTFLIDVVGKQRKNIIKEVRKRVNTRFILSWAIRNSEFYSDLKKAMFIHAKSPMPLVVKQQNINQNWHLTQADVDSF
jgi:N-acetylglutamate synthase-like GNAT family acetyltransferase